MGCGASSAGNTIGFARTNDRSKSNGIGSATMSLLPAGMSNRKGITSNATVAGVYKADAMPSKTIRLVLSRPFSRTEPLAQLLRRCAFPILREQCAKRGWRFIVIDPTSEADPSQDPRPDTLAVLGRQLDLCIKVSGGPALLSILDHTRGLPMALPPSQIPEAEYATLRDWMHGDECLLAISHKRLGRQAGMQEGEVSRLLDKWYRQAEVSLTGDKRGPFCLEVPPELRDSSMFTGRESLRVRRCLELSLLGEILSMAAPRAMCGKAGLQALKKNKKLAKQKASFSRPPPAGGGIAAPFAGESTAGLAPGAVLDPLGKLWEETERMEVGGKSHETRTMREEAAEEAGRGKQQDLAPGDNMRNGGYSSKGVKSVLPGIQGKSEGEDEEEKDDDDDDEASGAGSRAGTEADSLNDGQEIVYGSKYPADILRKYEASALEIAFDSVREMAGTEEGWRPGLVSVIHSSAGISGAPPRMADGQGLTFLFEVDAVKWKRVRKMKLGQDVKAVDAQLGIEPKKKKQGSGFMLGGGKRQGKGEQQRLPRHVRKELERLGNEERPDDVDHDVEQRVPSEGDETARDVLMEEDGEEGGDADDDVFKGHLSLAISRIEIEGFSAAAGIYCEVTLALPGDSKFEGERLVASTVRRKSGRDGRFLWRSLTSTPAGTRLVEDGSVGIKLMESRMVGADRCMGDFSVKIKDVARHEDDEEGVERDENAGAWHKILGMEAHKVGDEEQREVIGSGMLEMTVRSPGSGRELMRSAKAMINHREFGAAIDRLRVAIRRFVERSNGRAAAEAKALIEEVEMRRAMNQPSILRRLAWLRSDVMGEKKEGKGSAARGGKAASSVAHFFRASSNRVLAYGKGAIGQRQEPVQKGPAMRDNDRGVTFSSVDMPGQDGVSCEEALRVLESEMGRRGGNGDWEQVMMRAIDSFPDQAKVTLRGVTSSILRSLQQAFSREAAAGSESLDPLACEIVAHNKTREWHSSRFLGRAKLVDRLSFYACNNLSSPAHVEFVEGTVSGAGLTALLASVCHETGEKVKHKLIYRSCGATAVSRDMESLMHSIALQLECEESLQRSDDEIEASRPGLLEQPASYFAQRRRSSEIPFEYAGICRHLRLSLSKGTARHPIVVIIDALDLVRGNDVADTTPPSSTEGADLEPLADGLSNIPRLLQWLPLQWSPGGGPGLLPPYCRIIVGYSGQDKSTRALVKPLVGNSKANNNLVLLRGIPSDGDAPLRMLDRLNATGVDEGWTKLTSQQMYDLLPPKTAPQAMPQASSSSSSSSPSLSTHADSPRVNPLALYLSFRIAVLAAERGKDANALIGREKKGDYILEHGHLTAGKGGDNAQDVASAFMQTICGRHPGWGHRCLALLCCCQSGLTEDELLDLLSGAADMRQAPGGTGAVLGGDHSAADWAFQPASCPQLDALRLIADLDPLLHRIPADGTEVIAFSHSAFAKAAAEIACGTAEARRRSCLVLAAYFSGRDAAQTWLGGREEEVGTQAAMQVLLQGPGFPPQPFMRESVDGHRCLNLRSMRERVRALTGAGLYEAAREAVTDLGYCMAKAESGTLHLLIDEFDCLASSRVAATGQPKFLGLDGELRAFISAHRGTISRNPAMIFQLAANCRDGAAARSAHRHFDEGRDHPPWLKWRNPDSDEMVASRWALNVHPGGGVTAVASSSNGEVIGTAGNDRLACLWEVRNGRMLCQLPRLMQRVSCMALSDNLSHVAIGDGDGQLKMWALGSLGSSVGRSASHDNHKLPRLPETPEFGVTAHAGPVRAVAFLSSPDLAVSCGDDGVLKVWMVSTCSVLKVLGSHEKLEGSERGASTFVCVLKEQLSSPAGGAARLERRAGSAGQERIFSSGEDKCVREWNVASGLVRVYDGHRSHVTCVAVCSVGGILAAGGQDMTVRVWSLSSGRRIATVQHDAAVRFVAIDGSSATMASVCDEGMMRLWDSHSMSRIGQVDMGTHGGVKATGSKPGSRLVFALEPHDGLIAVGGPTGTLKSWEIRPPAFRAHSDEMGGVRCMSVSSMSMATLGGGRGVAVWDLRTGSRKRELGGYQACVNWLDMDSSRQWLLATASSSGDVMLWDTRGGDSRQPAAPVHTILAHVRGVKAVSFSPDGALLATCGSDGLARVYGVREPWGDHVPSAVHEDHPPPPPPRPFLTSDDAIQVWLIHNLVGHTEAIVACSFSPDSSGLVTVSHDGTMRLWSVKTGACSQIFTVTGGGGAGGGAAAAAGMTSAVWAPHMRCIISGGSDGVVRVWDIGRGKEIMSLRAQRVLQLAHGFDQEMIGLGTAWSWSEVDGHRGGVLCVAVSPDGSIIISGGQDGCVKAWAAHGGRLVRTLLRCSSWVQSLAVTADGGRVYAACGDGFIRALRLPAERTLAEETGGGHETAGSGIKLSPIKGKKRAGGGTRAKSPELTGEGGEQEVHASVDDGRTFEFGRSVDKLALCARGTLLASIAEKQNVVEVLETAKLSSGIRKHRLSGHTDQVTDVATGEETPWLVSSSMDGIVKVWDASTGMCKHSQPCFRQGASCVTLCPPREIAAVGSVIGDVQLVDLSAGGGQISKFEGPEGAVVSLQFAGDGHLLMYAHEDGYVGVRDLRGNAAGDNRLIDANRGGKAGGLGGGIRALTKIIGGKEGAFKPTRGGCCSSDGRMLFRACGKSIEAWDMRMMRRVHVDNTHAGAVRGLRALDDGRWIASGGSDCTVRIWSVPNGSDRVEAQEQWLDTRSAAVQAGWYGNKDVVPFRGPGQLSFGARQEVRCIAGFSVDSIFAGDASGRIYSLALEPGIGQF